MPTYEYECTKCNDRFEISQSIKDEPLTKCSKCSGKLRRLIGAGSGIIFKGSGFYATDYRSSNYTKGQSKEMGSSDTCSKKGCTGCNASGAKKKDKR